LGGERKLNWEGKGKAGGKCQWRRIAGGWESNLKSAAAVRPNITVKGFLLQTGKWGEPNNEFLGRKDHWLGGERENQ